MTESTTNPFSSKARHQVIENARQETERMQSSEKVGNNWGTDNSPLMEPKLFSFNSTFEAVLPPNYDNIREYIETTLKDKKGNAVGIELGGLGARLFSDFTPGFFKKSAAVNLSDNRAIQLIKSPQNHKVIVGDMNSEKAHKDALEWLKGEKTDLIIERLLAGIKYLPAEPYFLSDQANFWYQQLAENGILFAQLPDILKPYMHNWTENVKQNYSNTLDVQYGLWQEKYGVLRIHKKPGAPDNLPLLTPREVKIIRKQQQAIKEI